MIRMTATPINLLLRRSRWLSGPFIVWFANQQILASLRVKQNFKTI
jgi:hypothetical protein